MKIFRLIRSRPASAAYNMALDEKIFFRYLDDGIPAFRVYGWETPSFTYGVSQHPEEGLDMGLCASDGVGVAKRMTGGGILLHGDDVTYSFVCGKEDVGEPKGVLVSYREICAFLIRFYASCGLKASFAAARSDFKDKCVPHSLCSASCEKYDIVIGSRKIGGNAQKRARRAIFQHGSIPRSVNWDFARRYMRSLPADIASNVTALSHEMAVLPGKRALETKLTEAFAAEFGAHFKEENEDLYETRVAE
ncbi:MAG: lipoate--protein ligase family protein [Candidatus Omnitrophica bacterium]|nr:lipoate--protein ligase family protein [Candidatus Omnitrophota bacterium]MDD5436574.1 lipoate--protein ligase family protein [Candidatus Omnitrophota bacterium]